jgi:hypothetical protein
VTQKRQSRPFQVGGEASELVLQQNTGKQAAIISQIVQSQQEGGGSLFRFKQVALARWSALVSEVDQVVCKMPLWKLQTVGDERLEFLYENLDRGARRMGQLSVPGSVRSHPSSTPRM